MKPNFVGSKEIRIPQRTKLANKFFKKNRRYRRSGKTDWWSCSEDDGLVEIVKGKEQRVRFKQLSKDNDDQLTFAASVSLLKSRHWM